MTTVIARPSNPPIARTESVADAPRATFETVVSPTGEREPNFASVYASSIGMVSLLLLLGVGLPVSIYLDDYLAGFGLGAFTAFWGGPSFGVIVGSARMSRWVEETGSP